MVNGSLLGRYKWILVLLMALLAQNVTSFWGEEKFLK